MFGGRGRGGDRSRGGDSNGGSRGNGASGGPAARRYHVPAQQLPEGLSLSFLGKDANGDGQVMMHEFASNWSDSEVERFNKYDRNADGVITPQEWVGAEKN
jgi:hypothetical protein